MGAKMKFKVRVRADFSEIIEVEAKDYEEAEVKASQTFLDEFDPSTMSMSSLDTEDVTRHQEFLEYMGKIDN